jgi:Flp pilus assembly protein TadD
MRKYLRLDGAIVVIALVALTGCSGLPNQYELGRVADPPLFGMLPSEKPLDKGKIYYRDGDYGLAEQAFRQAVEEDHNNAEAWLGLAASYDRLRRFDQADRAYEVVIKLVGYTPTVLNNLGYHHILLGNREAARKTLTAAANADPNNPFIKNNIGLLEGAEPEAEPVRKGG